MALLRILESLPYRFSEEYDCFPYRVDFYIPELGLALEADGKGYHTFKGKDAKRDMEIGLIHNISVFRLKEKMLLENPEEAKNQIEEYIKENYPGR